MKRFVWWSCTFHDSFLFFSVCVEMGIHGVLWREVDGFFAAFWVWVSCLFGVQPLFPKLLPSVLHYLGLIIGVVTQVNVLGCFKFYFTFLHCQLLLKLLGFFHVSNIVWVHVGINFYCLSFYILCISFQCLFLFYFLQLSILFENLSLHLGTLGCSIQILHDLLV